MLIPIGTDAPIYHWPFATGALIVANILVFVLQCYVGEDYDWASRQQPAVASVLQDLPIQNQEDAHGDDEEQPRRGNEWDFDFDEVEQDGQKFEELVEELARQELLDRKTKGWLPYTLWIGDGLHPVQWLTSFFLHLDVMHLIGNMLFLALFGLVVESRLGNWQFAGYYMAIGIIDSCVTQFITLFVGEFGVALGASGAIYGVMMTAMLLAPRFNVICIIIVWVTAFFPRIPIMIFGVVYVLLDVTSIVFGDRLVDTGFLHVMGAAVGFVGASLILMSGRVNTEYEDFFSIVSELLGNDPKKKKRKLTPSELARQEEERQEREAAKRFKLEQIWRSIDTHLAADNLEAAIMMERQARQLDSTSRWDEPRLLRLIGKLQSKKDWDKVIFYSELYLGHYESRAITIQLNLAKVLLVHKHSPRKALKVVKPIDAETLDENQMNTYRQVVLKAKQSIDAGTLELGD